MPGGTSSERGSMRVTGSPTSSSERWNLYASACCQPRKPPPLTVIVAEPLHVRHPVPAGNDQPQRIAVLGRQRLPVHRVDEQHLVAERILEREAPFVQMLDARPGCRGRRR